MTNEGTIKKTFNEKYWLNKLVTLISMYNKYSDNSAYIKELTKATINWQLNVYDIDSVKLYFDTMVDSQCGVSLNGHIILNEQYLTNLNVEYLSSLIETILHEMSHINTDVHHIDSPKFFPEKAYIAFLKCGLCDKTASKYVYGMYYYSKDENLANKNCKKQMRIIKGYNDSIFPNNKLVQRIISYYKKHHFKNKKSLYPYAINFRINKKRLIAKMLNYYDEDILDTIASIQNDNF